MNKRILRHFGVEQKGFYRDEVFNSMVQDIRDGVMENEMIILAGQWGSGKTTLFREVKKVLSQDPDKAPIFVRVANEERRWMRISSILTALLLNEEIGKGEQQRKDLEARSLQVIRLLGEAHVNDKKKICLYIENAHELHTNTIRAIKNFRENDFAGVTPLLSIVLIGQPELLSKVNRFGEVKCRVSAYDMSEANGWMTYEKRVSYLKTVYDDALTIKARKRVANYCRSPLHMDYFVEQKMSAMHRAGKNIIDDDCFEMTPKEYYTLLEQSGKIGYTKLAKVAGVSKATISGVISGSDIRNRDKVLTAMKAIEDERNRDKESNTVDFNRQAAEAAV